MVQRLPLARRGEDVQPYDVLLLFDSREFEAHWFETGTPAFLVDKLFSRQVASVSPDQTVSTADLLSAFDWTTLAPRRSCSRPAT